MARGFTQSRLDVVGADQLRLDPGAAL